MDTNNLTPGAEATHDHFRSLIEEFQTVMGQEPDLDLAARLIVEECREVIEAAEALKESDSAEHGADFLKEVADFTYVLVGAEVMSQKLGVQNAINFSEEDAEVVSYAMRVMSDAFEVGIVRDEWVIEAVNRVHASNMSKMGEDGKPIFSEEGKVLKGPNYQPADLSDLGEAVADSFRAFIMTVLIQSAMEEHDDAA